VFAFMYAILFEKELLPVLNDRVVLFLHADLLVLPFSPPP